MMADEPPPAQEEKPVRTAKRRHASSRARIRELGVGALWVLGLSATMMLVDGFLASVPVARAILGALIAAVAGARSGFVWDLDDPDGLSTRRAAAMTVRGILIAGAATFVAIAASHALGWATVKIGKPDTMTLLAILTAAANAVREEVILRAIPLHFARRAGVPARYAIVFAALASPATFALSPAATLPAIVLAAAAGLLSAQLVRTSRNLYPAVGANLAFAFIVGPFSGGGGLAVEWSRGELARGATASGPPAYVLAALFVIAAVTIGRMVSQARRRARSPGSSMSSKSASSTTG